MRCKVKKRVISIVIFIVTLLLILGKIIGYTKKETVAAYEGKWKARISSQRISEQPVIFSHITIWVELLLSVKIQWKGVLVNGLSH